MAEAAHEQALAVALDAARAAGAQVLPLWRDGVEASWKGHRDPVTAADRDAEQVIRRRLRDAFPDDTVVGEEGETVDEAAVRGRRRWYVDPIDGTTNFLKGRGWWGISIGFCDADDDLAAGVVHAPVLGETFAAVRGGGATHNGSPIHRPDVTRLDEALLVVGALRAGHAGDTAAMLALGTTVLSVRITGSTALDCCDVALGRADAFWTTVAGPWDLAAGALIAAEAGAVVSDLRGAPFTGPGEQVVAAAPGVHERLVGVVVGAESPPASQTPRLR